MPCRGVSRSIVCESCGWAWQSPRVKASSARNGPSTIESISQLKEDVEQSAMTAKMERLARELEELDSLLGNKGADGGRLATNAAEA